jgi:hypothetical protein
MLSTATALIQATEDSIFDDDAMDFARMLTHTHNEMDSDQFAKAIYLYSGIIASTAVDRASKVLMTESQLKELMATIDEMETLRNEVLENGK